MTGYIGKRKDFAGMSRKDREKSSYPVEKLQMSLEHGSSIPATSHHLP